jgi:hypothetical protein
MAAPARLRWQRALRWGTLAGLGAVAALTVVVLLRYPGGPRALATTVAFAVLAAGSLAALAAGAWWRSASTTCCLQRCPCRTAT